MSLHTYPGCTYFGYLIVLSLIHLEGRTGVYFKALILISTLTSISHGIFEIIIQTKGSDIIERCGLTEIILRHIGFVQLGGLP